MFLCFKLHHIRVLDQVTLAVQSSNLVAKSEKNYPKSCSNQVSCRASFVFPITALSINGQKEEWATLLAKNSIVCRVVQELVFKLVIIDLILVVDTLF